MSAEGMTNLTDLTVRNLTVSGTIAQTGAITATGGITLPTTAKVQFRDTGLYMNSGADGKLTISADGTGADDLTLSCTTTASDNITVSTDKKVLFRDTAIYLNSSADGQLDIDADGEVEITTVLVDLNGNLDVSGTTAIGDDVTVATNKKIQLRDTGLFIHSSADGKILYSSDGTGADDHTFAGTVTFNDGVTFSDDVTADIVTASVFDQTRVGYKHDFDEIAAALASTSMVYYYTGGGTSGTQAIAAVEGGVIQLSTTSTGSRSSTLIYAGSIVADNDKEWEYKCRFKLNDITNTKMDIGMYVDGNDEIILRFDTAVNAANLYLVTENNNGGEVVEDTTVDLVADTWYTLAIEVSADDSFVVYIDDTQVLKTHTGTIRDVAFKPYAYVDNKTAAEEKILSIDYISFNQNR